MVLVHFEHTFMRDNQMTGIGALGIIDANHKVGDFSRQVKVLRHRNLYPRLLVSIKANLFLKRHVYIELGIVDYRLLWRNRDSLTVSQLTLSIFIAYKLKAYRHDLCLQKVSYLGSEIVIALAKVERLRQVCQQALTKVE